MKITQENYEQYFLDHVEGTLSPEMEKELADFLECNPDLKPVLGEYDNSPLQMVKISNEELKARLKKHLIHTARIREDNADNWMIRDIEGLLDESEEKELMVFLTLNPAYRFDYKIFGCTRLSPDLSVGYRRKKELKKKVTHFPVRRLVWLIPAAAAALVLLIIGIRHFNSPQTRISHQATPAIAVLPTLPSPEIGTFKSTTPVVEKKILNNGTPSQIRIYTSRIKPLPANEIILSDPKMTTSLNLSGFDLSPIATIEKKDRSLFSRVFSNMLAHAAEGIGNRANPDKYRKPDFSFWSVAKAGISGFNSISDREIELYVRKDDDGRVKSYALVEQERLILSKELNKN